MIIDLEKFIKTEQPYFHELEKIVNSLEADPYRKMDLKAVKRFHYVYQRVSGDLAQIATFSSEKIIRNYLETIVGKAYGHIHERPKRTIRFFSFAWFFESFPKAFRKHSALFLCSLGVFLCGSLFGGIAITLDPESKEVLMPFHHLTGNPSDRVKMEENSESSDRLEGKKASFSSYLMTHNTRIAIFTMAMGMTWGIGTLILLFYNGVILGAVIIDYILAGETIFLCGWLLPHGTIEIPAILIAGQAGFLLANALIGWGTPVSIKNRLANILKDLIILIGGVGTMLIWAGLIEAFFSQYHEPVIPYALKILFGVIELIVLILFLGQTENSVFRRELWENFRQRFKNRSKYAGQQIR